MRNGFTALVWKEAAEARRFFQVGFIVFALAFAGALAFNGFAADVGPARGFMWFGPLMAIAAAIVGFWQTYRESRGDMWAFAIHRSASGRQMFAAKWMVGAGALLAAAGVPYMAAMAWLAMPGHSMVPFDRSYWLPGIADFLAALTWYAGGLYAGSRRRGHVVRGIGLALALVGTLVVLNAHSFATASLWSIVFTALLTVAAWADWISGSEFDAQPAVGRAANVLSAVPAVAFVLFVITATTGFAVATMRPAELGRQVSSGPLAAVTGDGRLVLIASNHEVTDLSGRRLRELDSAVANSTIDRNVILSVALATDQRTTSKNMGGSYRDPREGVTHLITGISTAPYWYYERREGLISIYDKDSRSIYGWVGPDGLSIGAEQPARRFSGQVQMELDFPPHLLVLSDAVYDLGDLAHPRLAFKAPEGETVLQAIEGVQLGGDTTHADPVWGPFNVVTTTTRTYVVDKSGAVQLSVAHPAADAGRRVAVYRAAYTEGAPTFIWYSPRAGSTDTLNHVLKFNRGSAAPVEEYRFAGARYSQFPRDEALAAGSSSTLGDIVAGVVQNLETRSVGVAALLIWLLSAGVAFGLCRRAGFARERVVAWTALAILTGPIALVVMWMLIEWPPREVCPACGKSRVVNRELCEHCSARFRSASVARVFG